MMPITMLSREAKLTFRNQLRDGRDHAARDAEGFHEVIFAVERIGIALSQGVGTLKEYEHSILELAKKSVLAEDLPKKWREFHAPAWWLYDTVRAARNDALHQGAIARHLAKHAVILSLILEDALMSHSAVVADFMVRDPLCAQAWQPLSFVRQQMLTSSFSFLPVLDKDDGWKLISDYSLAACLRTTAQERNRRMALTVERAVKEGLLKLEQAALVYGECPILDVVPKLSERPVLVIRSSGSTELVGILSPFDVL